MNAEHILNREYLELRCRLLDLAASLDRLQRAEGSLENDLRLERLRQGLNILLTAGENRAEQLQLLFSREYEPSWRNSMGLARE